MRVGVRSVLLIWCYGFLALQGSGQAGLRFIENKGQWPANVTFRAELGEATLWCERDAIVIDRFDAAALSGVHANIHATLPVDVRHHAVRLKFLSAGSGIRPEGDRRTREHYNFFQGNDPSRWVSKARAFGRVVFHEIAPGCDAIFMEGRAGLKYDLVIAPGADPAEIRFTYEGAERLSLRDGALIVSTSMGRLVERIPLAYQDIDGERTVVPCSYTLKNGIVGVHPAAYDPAHPLVIDPTLSFATYSGSFSNNFGYTATFDQAGFLYAGSTAFGTQFPVTMGAYETTWSGGTTDIAITKYDTTGTFLVWSTYLGGTAAEMPHSLIVDDNDQLLVLGTTGSSDFPITTGAADNSFGGGANFTPTGLGLTYPNGCDMIVARFSADGSALLGSTYLGGSANDGLNSAPGLKFNYADEVRGEVLLDAQGRVWVVSCSQSNDAPISAGAAQPVFGGGTHDGYVARFDPLLTQLQYGSFLGGSAADAAFAGEFDTLGRLFVCGGTASTDLPVSPSAFDGSYNGGVADAFVARFSLNGSSLEALSYWGASTYDQAYFVELDHNDDVYLFGQTNAPSGELTTNTPYNIAAGGQFISKFDPQLSSLLLSSRIGSGDGTPDISPTAFLVDVCDKIYTSGWGSNAGGLGGALTTTGLPVTSAAYQSTTTGHDLYLAVFDINMADLTYATYYGGGASPEHVDGGTSRFDRRGRVYQSVCAGCQNNDDFPTSPGAWSATNNSTGCNNGVVKFDFDAPLVIAAFNVPDSVCGSFAEGFLNLSSGATSYEWDFGDGENATTSNPTHTYPVPGIYTITLTAFNPNSCNAQDVTQRTIVILPAAPVLVAVNDTSICGPLDQFVLSASSGGTASDWQWSSTNTFSDVLNTNPADSTALLSPVTNGTYYVRAESAAGCFSIDSTSVFVSLPAPSLTGTTTICAGDTALLEANGLDPGSTIQWSPSELILSGASTPTATTVPLEQTTYVADVVSPSGCTWQGTITVDVSTVAGSSVSASADATLVLPGTIVHLLATPTSGVSYNWIPAAALNDATLSNPTAVMLATTTFIVTVSDGICSRADDVTVTVYDVRCEEPDIFVPNTFTPNGDGVNDSLFVRGNQIDRMEFKVFDRWGEKVFEATDPAKGWNGQFEGKLVDPAVFVYHLTVWCKDGQRYFTKGNVTLVR